MIPNPIPSSVRGWLYVLAAVVGFLILVASSVLSVVGLEQWITVLAVASGGITTLVGLLSRSNLSDGDGAELTGLTDAEFVASLLPDEGPNIGIGSGEFDDDGVEILTLEDEAVEAV